MAITVRTPSPVVPPDANPLTTLVKEQVTVTGTLNQEKLPMIPEIDSLVVSSTVPVRQGGGKQKLASALEEPAISRHYDQIQPEFIKGRNSEYPRG